MRGTSRAIFAGGLWNTYPSATSRSATVLSDVPVYAKSLGQIPKYSCIVASHCWSSSLVFLPVESSLPNSERLGWFTVCAPITEEEIKRLFRATQERPLNDALTIRRGKNKGKPLAKITAKERQRLIQLGKRRARIYKFMIQTGLRRNEVACLTIANLHLDTDKPTSR